MAHSIDTLPKWAQALFTKLNSDLEYWKAVASDDSDEGSNTKVHVPGNVGESWNLPNSSRIRFGSDEDWVEACVNEDEELVLMASGAIYIEPQAANHIIVKGK